MKNCTVGITFSFFTKYGKTSMIELRKKWNLNKIN